MKHDLLQIRIGQPDWHRAVRSYTDQFDRHFWDNFTPANPAELRDCEASINRTLPPDFREFMLHFGHGRFPRNGTLFCAPEDIAAVTPGPLWMLLGSTDWASDDDHRRFYATRGQFNPAPDKFTPQALAFEGTSLLDLLQVGADGSCCYHQLHVGDAPRKPFGYCLLTPEGTAEDKLPSFSTALGVMLTREHNAARRED